MEVMDVSTVKLQQSLVAFAGTLVGFIGNLNLVNFINVFT